MSGAYWAYPTQSNTEPNCLLSLAGSSNNDANYYSLNGSNWIFTDSTNFLTPVGLFLDTTSPCGAYDMGGDVWQWNETLFNGTVRGERGGSWFDFGNELASSYGGEHRPEDPGEVLGFRVASVPEPGSLTLLLACCRGVWNNPHPEKIDDFKTAGPHLFRFAKKGDSLTLAVCANYEGGGCSRTSARRCPISPRRRPGSPASTRTCSSAATRPSRRCGSR